MGFVRIGLSLFAVSRSSEAREITRDFSAGRP